ncbi:hypothetical protein BKA66DRAFT_566753 [Pyrenochaeta sp. MPI-SDFR-AT-0127]|nr:hypothetical protein BKA66DRAFT_566753 [Pyrenochaeta sp. MPI-SDFR-AT-0127]
MCPQKRKNVEEKTTFESRRMRLRTTPQRLEYGIKLQNTPRRPNAFFDHFPLDVRRLLYGHMTLRPFPRAKDYLGLYLSCRQAGMEMDQAAPSRLRAYLLNRRNKHSSEKIEIWLPNHLDYAPIPIDLMMDIRIKIKQSTFTAFPFEAIMRLATDLSVLRLNQVHIHILETKWDQQNLELREMMNAANATLLISRLISPNEANTENIGRKHILRVKELIVSWQSGSEGVTDKIEWMDGWKYETASAKAHRPYGYRFKQDNAGARVVVTPRPFQPECRVTEQEMRTVVGHHLRSIFDVRVSRATMEFETLEIGDGEVIPACRPAHRNTVP